MKKAKRDAWMSEIVQKLMDAKTEEDLEAAADLADEAVAAGIISRKTIDAIWDDLEPDIHQINRRS